MSDNRIPDRADRYPTRLEKPSAPIPRAEPTVWGGVPDGPLCETDLKTMAANGYLVRRSAVGDNWLSTLRDELNHIGVQADPADPRIIRKPGGSIRWVFQPHLLSDVIAEVVTLGSVLPVARQLLGSDVYLHQARIT